MHNFPRFLESWSGDALYIRGSLVCLYESEVDDSPWRIDYYGPPARNWGFSELFLNGTYPPGTPLLRTYRRMDYTNLSASEYAAAIQDLPWSDELLESVEEISEEVGGEIEDIVVESEEVVEEIIEEVFEEIAEEVPEEEVEEESEETSDEEYYVSNDDDDDDDDYNPWHNWGWGSWGWGWWNF